GDDVRPGSRLADGHSRKRRDRRVVVDAAVGGKWTAVTMVRVFAQARIGDGDDPEVQIADAPEGLLHDPVLGYGLRADGILRLGQAEQDQAADAERGKPRRFIGSHVGRHPEDARHGGDRSMDARTRLNEERRDQHGRIETGLAHEGTQRGRAPQPSWTDRSCGWSRGGRRSPSGAVRRRRLEIDHRELSSGSWVRAAAVAPASALPSRLDETARTRNPAVVAAWAVSGPMQTAGIEVTSSVSAAASDSRPRTV